MWNKHKILLISLILSLVSCNFVQAESTGKAYYMNDYLSFAYPDDMLGTITMEECDGTLYYHCKSYTDIFSADIRIINKEQYCNNRDLGLDEWKNNIFKEEDNAAYTITLTENPDYLEKKMIQKLDGTITYLKLLGESEDSFVLVEWDGINENPNEIGDAFSMIYESVKVSDYYLENGFVADGYNYERIIFGKAE